MKQMKVVFFHISFYWAICLELVKLWGLKAQLSRLPTLSKTSDTNCWFEDLQKWLSGLTVLESLTELTESYYTHSMV